MTTTTRHDVSAVSPQDSYAAKRCPVRIQNDVLRPSEPLANISAESLMRMADGVRFDIGIGRYSLNTGEQFTPNRVVTGRPAMSVRDFVSLHAGELGGRRS